MKMENSVWKQKVQDKANSNAWFDIEMFCKEVLEFNPISKFHHFRWNLIFKKKALLNMFLLIPVIPLWAERHTCQQTPS